MTDRQISISFCFTRSLKSGKEQESALGTTRIEVMYYLMAVPRGKVGVAGDFNEQKSNTLVCPGQYF